MALIDLAGPVIGPGEALSSALDCRAGVILRVSVPVNWSGSYLTFQVGSSPDGPFSDLFDNAGKERRVYVRPGTTVLVNIQPPGATAAFAFIRFRSGRRDRPVPQAGDAPAVFMTTIDDGKETGPIQPPPAEVPTVIDMPVAMPAPSCAVGDELSCTTGRWNGEPSSYWQTWLADSAVVGNGATYVVQPGDSGRSIQCSVTATNAAGSGNAMSNVVSVAGGSA